MTECIKNKKFSPNNYQFEAARLESFHNWPHLWKKSEEFAAAGFYYTGNRDIVKCFECGIELWKWKEKDVPMFDHRQCSRNCSFVHNIPCDYVLIDTDPSPISTHVPKGMDECGIYEWTNMPKSNSNCRNQVICELKKHTSKPKHPKYTNYSARLASYDKWPKALSQSKEELATAGFYYSGSGDETLCYYCGGGLMEWDPNDDPWIEHAKWFKKCPYLLLTKGIEFVNNITGKIETETIPSAVNKLNNRLEKDSSESIASGSSQNSTNSEITNDNTEASTVSGEAKSEEQSVQTQSNKPRDKDATLCKICFSREFQIAFIPCGHLFTCAKCADNMKICGICRKDIEMSIQVYIS